MLHTKFLAPESGDSEEDFFEIFYLCISMVQTLDERREVRDYLCHASF